MFPIATTPSLFPEVPAALVCPATPSGRYKIPIYRVTMVREGSETGERESIGTPRHVAEVAASILGDLDREALLVFMLSTKNKIIGVNTVSIGDLSSSIVHPREVFKAAILANACSIILSHNHPSGDPTPSSEDVHVSKRLIQAGELLGIDVLDHVVIGESGKFVSLKERGLI